MLKAIHAQEDAKAAKEKACQIVEKLKLMGLSKAAEIVENGIDETLSYYSLPAEHWRCTIHSTARRSSNNSGTTAAILWLPPRSWRCD